MPANTVNEEVYQGHLSRLRIRNTNLKRPLALLKLKKTKLNTPLEIFVSKLLEYGADSKKK